MTNTAQSSRPTTDATATRVLAALLERLDQHGGPIDATQYRAVAERLSAALSDTQPGEELDALLAKFTSAREVYENLQYRHAGLCRSALEPALAAEQNARGLIERVRARRNAG